MQSLRAAARVCDLSETTIRNWITRAGLHSRSVHDRLIRGLTLTHVQFDELRLKIKETAEAVWFWVACDARTKLIPAFVPGSRTKALAHQLVHQVAQRLAPGCLPVFSSDGLALYFYELTAHFGAWVQAAGERRRHWTVNAQLLYAQVIKCYRCQRVAEVRHHVYLGTPEAYFSDALAVVRQHIWSHSCFQLSGARTDSAKPSLVLRNRLIPALCYTP